MTSGLVRPFSEDTIVPREADSPCIVLIVEFLAMSTTEAIDACVIHHIRFTIPELPPTLQDRRLARVLQRNWANRLFHRLSRLVW